MNGVKEGVRSAWHRGKSRSLRFLGADALQEQTLRFVWTHVNFLLFTAIPGVFINTFFFRIDGRISTVAVFNAVSLLGSALVMQFSSTLSLRVSPVTILRIGIGLYNLFYVTLLLLQTQAVHYMLLLAALNAIATGFYWQSYNILLRRFSDNETLDRVISIFGMASSVVTLLVPIVSGYIIARSGSLFGYTVVFLLAFLSSLYTAWCSTRIGRFKLNAKSTLGPTYRRIFTDRVWRLSYFADFFRGLRDAAFPLFLTIVFYQFVTNEALLGVNNTVCGLAGLIFFYFGGRYIRPHNRIRVILLTSLFLTACFAMLFFKTSAFVIFLLSVLNALYGPMIANPAVATFYYYVNDEGGRLNNAQIMAAREVFFSGGRAVGLVLLILVFSHTALLPAGLLALNLAALLSALCYHRAGRRGAQ